MTRSRNRSVVTGRRKTSGNLVLGIALLVVGSLLFAREFGVDLPDWFFRWELILVVVGISIGLKSGFRDFGWIAVTGLGLFFLSDDIFPGWNATRFLVPAGLLALGAFIILTRMSASSQRNTSSRFNNENSRGTDNPDLTFTDQSNNPEDEPGSEKFTNTADQLSNGPDQINKSADQSGNRPDQSGNRADQFGNRPNEFSNRPGQANNPGEQFYNMADTSDTRSEPLGNSSETFSNRPDQYSNRPGQNANIPGQQSSSDQFGNRSGHYDNRAWMEEEQLDIVSVFSAVNRKVFSKNFIGGEIVCVFGGSEVNMMNADISAGTVELEVVCIFGGATLFIPPNWNVRSEMGSVFGGVDDKRRNAIPDASRTLIIKGVCIFGGLEVKTKIQ